MERVELPLTEIEGVCSVTVLAPGVEPGAVLARTTGRARGFWARGDRWVVHEGTVARIAVDPSTPDPARFLEVWGKGSSLLRRVEEVWNEPGLIPRPARMYGGFSFRSDDARSEACWSSFPPASFLLPAVEVGGSDGEVTVTVRAPHRRPDSRTREELRDRARRIARELAEGAAPAGTPAPVSARLAESDEEEWAAAVEEAIGWIRRGRVSKVVLARVLDVVARGPVDPGRVALALWHDNPGTHVFLYEPTPGRAVVGAAPETVATVEGGVFRATAVAGSISRGEAPEEQEALALRLLESEKDRVEHAIAVDDMIRRLRPLSEELSWDSEPHVLTLSRIQHLETRIKARLVAGKGALPVLAALHPTPAVCGLPRDPALEFLRMEEPFDRGWYAGPVGWFDAAGDGVFAPALRSGVLEGRRWRLFAGAGIVAASDPGLEWEETRIKFEPMLRALEAAGLRRGEAG